MSKGMTLGELLALPLMPPGVCRCMACAAVKCSACADPISTCAPGHSLSINRGSWWSTESALKNPSPATANGHCRSTSSW